MTGQPASGPAEVKPSSAEALKPLDVYLVPIARDRYECYYEAEEIEEPIVLRVRRSYGDPPSIEEHLHLIGRDPARTSDRASDRASAGGPGRG